MAVHIRVPTRIRFIYYDKHPLKIQSYFARIFYCRPTSLLLPICLFSFHTLSRFPYYFSRLRVAAFFHSSTVCLNDAGDLFAGLMVSSNVLAVPSIIPLSLRSLKIYLTYLYCGNLFIVIVASWTAELTHQSLRSHVNLYGISNMLDTSNCDCNILY